MIGALHYHYYHQPVTPLLEDGLYVLFTLHDLVLSNTTFCLPFFQCLLSIFLWFLHLLSFYPMRSILLFSWPYSYFFSRARCSVHWPLASTSSWMISFTSINDCLSSFLVLSLLVTSSIALSVFLWIIADLSLWWMVRDQFSAAYVNPDSMTLSLAFFFQAHVIPFGLSKSAELVVVILSYIFYCKICNRIYEMCNS